MQNVRPVIIYFGGLFTYVTVLLFYIILPYDVVYVCSSYLECIGCVTCCFNAPCEMKPAQSIGSHVWNKALPKHLPFCSQNDTPNILEECEDRVMLKPEHCGSNIVLYM